MGKGRSKELIIKRDIALIKRYTELTEVNSLRFDRALILLENEFFITEERIMAIIRKFCKENPEAKVNPVPKVRMPRLNKSQLALIFQDQESPSYPQP